jgi:hypothetical protein
MFFEIIDTNRNRRFIRTKSKLIGEEIEKRLLTLKNMRQIHDFSKIDFKMMYPDQLLKP